MVVDFEELYRKNKDFREYVDRFCNCRNIPAMEALKFKTVQYVGLYYKGEER